MPDLMIKTDLSGFTIDLFENHVCSHYLFRSYFLVADDWRAYNDRQGFGIAYRCAGRLFYLSFVTII